MRSAEYFYGRFEKLFADRQPKPYDYTGRKWMLKVGDMLITRKLSDPHSHWSISYEFELDGVEFYCGVMQGDSDKKFYTWLLREPDDLQRAELNLTL